MSYVEDFQQILLILVLRSLNNGVEVQVKEYEEKEEKIKRYEAEFEYAGAQYEIKGVVEKEEFEKILKNLYFSK